ncbi:multidrug resistance-associated protein 5 [Tanacetum coccineum]|uniref:Multidrug resistance-associated protein 5 n=1 Tax=Tanacetum coccineum TaxID=301880 RepID=A0ABQ5H683_9ASTR
MAEGTTKVRSGSEGFTIYEGRRTCSCRMWQLSGIPCVHATKVIFLINRVPESYVPAWFETDMYFVTYHNYVKPVPDMNLWPDQSMYSTVLPPKPKKMPGRPRKKRIRSVGEGGSSTRVSKIGVDDLEDVDVVQRGPVRDEGARRSRGGARWSRGRGGVVGSRGGASGSRGGASVSRGVVGGSRRGFSVSGGASGSTGRRADGSGGASGSSGRGASGSGDVNGSRGRGAGGSRWKPVSTAETQKRQGKKNVGTSGFAKWFGLLDEPEQATLRMPSVRILQRKLGKQDSSQNIALNVE